MRRLSKLLLVFALSAPACSTPRRSAAGCPDNLVLHCLTARTCAWDARRGCEVCRCADAPYRAAESPQGTLRPDPLSP